MSSTPTDKKLYSRAKSKVKKRSSVWPSAYASGQLVSEYKKMFRKKYGSRKRPYKERSKTQSLNKQIKKIKRKSKKRCSKCGRKRKQSAGGKRKRSGKRKRTSKKKSTRRRGIRFKKGSGRYKYTALVPKDGKIKKVNFGHRDYQHYKDSVPASKIEGGKRLWSHKNHYDKKRRDNYRKRHSGVKTKSGNKAYKVKYSPSWFSYHYLW